MNALFWITTILVILVIIGLIAAIKFIYNRAKQAYEMSKAAIENRKLEQAEVKYEIKKELLQDIRSQMEHEIAKAKRYDVAEAKEQASKPKHKRPPRKKKQG